MRDLPSITRHRLATALFAAAIALPAHAMAMQTTTAGQDDGNTQANAIVTLNTPVVTPAGNGEPSGSTRGSMVIAPDSVPAFTTTEDARAFWYMLTRAYALPTPDPRTVARELIEERLGIDGDEYVVAHFPTALRRMEGSADSVVVLTDALMQAFPEHSRHEFFGRLADILGGLSTGGRQSPDALNFVESVGTCGTAKECFTRVGRFLWSRTGPGYIYNTFIGNGNVLSVVSEDMRPLDEAFAIYPKAATFLPRHASPILLSQVIGKLKEESVFSELPYIRQLNAAFDTYWATWQSEWLQVARYQFVYLARRARARGVLTQDQYELVMKGGAPLVPLDGPVSLQQLSSTPADALVKVMRFDINGYAASDIVRFVAVDGTEVLFISGSPSPFLSFRNKGELREWVVRQARNRDTLDDLLSHFSLYNTQDGTFRTGVAQGLRELAAGRWTPDDTAIDAGNASIQADIFEDMRIQAEARLRDDARMQTSTAWDAWRTTLNRTATVLGPLGYAPPLAIPVQAGSALLGLGTGIEQGIYGRTAEERKAGIEQAMMTAVTSGVSTAMVGHNALSERTGGQAPVMPVRSSASLQRVNGQIGYLMGSVTGPQLPAIEEQAAGGLQNNESGITHLLLMELESQRRRVLDPVAHMDDRQPPVIGENPGPLEQGYLVMKVPFDATARTRQIIDLKKAAIDGMRHRLEDFRTDSLTTNAIGSRLSFDHSIVYRVDDRTPQQLLATGGFGPSSQFHAISPMLRQPSTIGSGSLVASNLVFGMWQQSVRPSGNFHQYAIWTDRRTVASASENNHLSRYSSPADEVHFPADVPAKDIYIIDSYEPVFTNAIARIYESRYVSTPYGIPLEAFTEYLAGRLDIDAPNKFTPQRISLNLPSRTPSPDGSRSPIDISYLPLSSHESPEAPHRVRTLR